MTQHKPLQAVDGEKLHKRFIEIAKSYGPYIVLVSEMSEVSKDMWRKMFQQLEDEALAFHDRQLETKVREAKEKIVFDFMRAETEGLFDNGDLFIKRKPLEQIAINVVGYEGFKAMQEAINAALRHQDTEKHNDN